MAPSTKAKAACGGTTPWAASDIVRSTVATLECAAQVIAAAMITSMIGCVAIVPISRRRLGTSSKGVSIERSSCRARSISPRPIATRPRSRVRLAKLRRNRMTPTSTNSGATRAMLKDNSCTISVVPTLAPSMTASAGTRSTNPPAAKLAAMSPVAVLLCNTAVTPRPARKAGNRRRSVRPRNRRKCGPKPRWMPLCTICTPHSSRAIEPARSINVRVVSIPPLPRPRASTAHRG